MALTSSMFVGSKREKNMFERLEDGNLPTQGGFRFRLTIQQQQIRPTGKKARPEVAGPQRRASSRALSPTLPSTQGPTRPT